jgi:hypothetical protein
MRAQTSSSSHSASGAATLWAPRELLQVSSAPASAVVVDTDVVSYLFKHDCRAEVYRPHLTGRLLVASFMTVAELDRWALERDWGEARRARMEQIYATSSSIPSTVPCVSGGPKLLTARVAMDAQ